MRHGHVQIRPWPSALAQREMRIDRCDGVAEVSFLEQRERLPREPLRRGVVTVLELDQREIREDERRRRRRAGCVRLAPGLLEGRTRLLRAPEQVERLPEGGERLAAPDAGRLLELDGAGRRLAGGLETLGQAERAHERDTGLERVQLVRELPSCEPADATPSQRSSASPGWPVSPRTAARTSASWGSAVASGQDSASSQRASVAIRPEVQ